MARLTGSPSTIHTWATRYGDLADAITSASQQLNALEAGDGQISIAVLEYQTNAEYLATNIALAEPRYRAVQEALDYYADELEAAKQQELDAISAASTASTNYSSAQADYYRYWELYTDETVEEQKQTYHDKAEEAWALMEESRIALEQSEIDEANAITREDNAGRRAAGMIDTAINGDGMKDSWWDDFGKGLYEILSVVAIVLLVIVFVLAIVVLIAATVLTGGAALPAAIPAALALFAGAATVVGAIMAVSTLGGILEGEQGLETQLIWDMIGMIPFSKFLKGPIGQMLKSMDLPTTGPGSFSSLPTTANRSQAADDFLEAYARNGAEGESVAQAFMDSNIDIFATIGGEAGQGWMDTWRQNSNVILPNLEPNTGAVIDLPDANDPIVLIPLTGDTQQVQEDPYAEQPLLPDYVGSSTFGGGPSGVPSPMPETGPSLFPDSFVWSDEG